MSRRSAVRSLAILAVIAMAAAAGSKPRSQHAKPVNARRGVSALESTTAPPAATASTAAPAPAAPAAKAGAKAAAPAKKGYSALNPKANATQAAKVGAL